MENEEKLKNLEFELKKTKEELVKVKAGYDDFIHLAAHDLQAPVRKITTMLDRFIYKTGDSISEEAKNYIERINKSLDQMTSLVNDISSLSQIKISEEGLQKIELNDCVQKIITAFTDKTISIIVEPLPIVNGDPNLIKYLFTELIINAAKFRRQDIPVEINISAERINEEEKIIFDLPITNIYIKINVHDNGIGFNPEMAERILRPFQRLHGNSTYKGNGIGLAICKKIVTIHGGLLIATGKENEGATFSVILPEIQN